MKPIVVKRRFTVERDSTGCHLQFGQGSESEMSSPSIANPRDVVLQLHGKSHVTDREFDPYNLLKTDKVLSIIKTLKYNDEYLRPPLLFNSKYDMLSGSIDATTPLRYNLSYRNYFDRFCTIIFSNILK